MKYMLINYKVFFILITIFFAHRAMIYATCAEFYFIPGYDLCYTGDYFWDAIFFLIAISPIIFIYKKSGGDAVLLWTLYLMHVFCTISLMSNTLPEMGYARKFSFSLIILISFFCICKFSSLKNIKISNVNISSLNLILLMISFCMIAIIIIYRSFEISYSLPSLLDVYGVRGEFKEQVASEGGIIGVYAMLMGGFSLAPIAVCFAITFWRQHALLSGILLFCALLLSYLVFSTAAFKSIAFMPWFVGAVYFISLKFDNPVKPFLYFWGFIFIIGWLLYIFDIDKNLFLHWLRRTFIAPGMNNIFFFERYGFHSFGEATNAPADIMNEYYRSVGSANAGLYGNGLALAGIIGIVINTLLLSVYIWIARSVWAGLDLRLTGAAILPFGYAISNSALTTSLVSYGGLLTLFIFFLGRYALLQANADRDQLA